MKRQTWSILVAVITIAACSESESPVPAATTPASLQANAFVQLFEWQWPDVAAECENFLGPAGYSAVQISPPMEHTVGEEWWWRYQPISYKIESRSGTRTEFAEMVKRCADSGVDIYADAVTNHMADVGTGVGVAGSVYDEYSYPVPYEFDDFHHCGRYGDETIRDYQDLWEIQTCRLNLLADLDTGKPAVQTRIAAYLNDLLSLGVAGFRMDAAKHISHDDIREILQLVDGDPFVFQEVIDRGGEAIDARAYLGNGRVTEFKYPIAMVEAFEHGNLAALTGFDTQAGWLPADKAIVFVDNHDLQRGHAGGMEVVSYKDGARYDLAVAFMLAYPYGYPMVMSSYRFDNGDQGPPDSSPRDTSGSCQTQWVCEHGRPGITSMLKFRQATNGTEVVNWNVDSDTVLSFGRGEKGHVIFNIDDAPAQVTVTSNLPTGDYVDIISGEYTVSVNASGMLSVNIGAQSAIAILRK